MIIFRFSTIELVGVPGTGADPGIFKGGGGSCSVLEPVVYTKSAQLMHAKITSLLRGVWGHAPPGIFLQFWCLEINSGAI